MAQTTAPGGALPKTRDCSTQQSTFFPPRTAASCFQTPVPLRRALETHPLLLDQVDRRGGAPWAPGYLDVGVLHPGWREGCGRVSITLEVEDSEGLLARAPGPRQGEALEHGEAERGVHVDGASAWDPAGAQPVGQARRPLHVAHLVRPHTVLFLIQAAQLLPLWGEGGQLGGGGESVGGCLSQIQEGLEEGDL